jgi:hypothetical protein
VTAWAARNDLVVGRGVTEVGSALNGKRRQFLALLRDQTVTTIVVEHRDRFARFGSEYVEAALAARGRRLLVVDPSEVDDDLVGDVTEMLTSLCARLSGRWAAHGAERAIAAAIGNETRRSTRPGPHEASFVRCPGGWLEALLTVPSVSCAGSSATRPAGVAAGSSSPTDSSPAPKPARPVGW